MSAIVRITNMDDGSTVDTCTLGEFLTSNAEVTVAEAAAILAGEPVDFGGGAQPWTRVQRVEVCS